MSSLHDEDVPRSGLLGHSPRIGLKGRKIGRRVGFKIGLARIDQAFEMRLS